MIHVVLPFALASILAGAGVHAILARRNAVLMLIGVELVLAAANLILVTASAVLPDRDSAGQILAVFIITLAAAEVTLALGIILFAFRQRGHIDLTRGLFEDDDIEDPDAGADEQHSDVEPNDDEPNDDEPNRDVDRNDTEQTELDESDPATDASAMSDASAGADTAPDASGATRVHTFDGDAPDTPDAPSGGPR